MSQTNLDQNAQYRNTIDNAERKRGLVAVALYRKISTEELENYKRELPRTSNCLHYDDTAQEEYSICIFVHAEAASISRMDFGMPEIRRIAEAGNQLQHTDFKVVEA